MRQRVSRLWLYIRIRTHKSKGMFLLTILQFMVAFLLINSVVGSIFFQDTSLLTYLDVSGVSPGQSCLLLTFDANVLNEVDCVPDRYAAGEAVMQELRQTEGVLSVGFAQNQIACVLKNESCMVTVYDRSLWDLHHPLSQGEWFSDADARECILSNRLAGSYRVGDTVVLPVGESGAESYTVIGFLPETSYQLNSIVSGNRLALSDVLQTESERYATVLILGDLSESSIPYSVWLHTDRSPEEMTAALRSFGNVFTVDALRAQENAVRWQWIKADLGSLAVLLLLAFFLAVVSALLSFYQNVSTFAVLGLLGAKRRHMVTGGVGLYALLMAVSFLLQLILAHIPMFATVFLNDQPLLWQGYLVSAGVALVCVAVCWGVTALLFRRPPVTLYVQNR